MLLYTMVIPAPVHVSPSPYLHKIDKHECGKAAGDARAVLGHVEQVTAAASGARYSKRVAHANL